jgi:hypothetical protein
MTTRRPPRTSGGPWWRSCPAFAIGWRRWSSSAAGFSLVPARSALSSAGQRTRSLRRRARQAPAPRAHEPDRANPAVPRRSPQKGAVRRRGGSALLRPDKPRAVPDPHRRVRLVGRAAQQVAHRSAGERVARIRSIAPGADRVKVEPPPPFASRCEGGTPGVSSTRGWLRGRRWSLAVPPGRCSRRSAPPSGSGTRTRRGRRRRSRSGGARPARCRSRRPA